MENKKSRLLLGILVGLLIGMVIGVFSVIIYNKLMSGNSKNDITEKEPINKIEDNAQDNYDKIEYKVTSKENGFLLLVNNKNVKNIDGNSVEVVTQLKDALIIKVFDLDYFNYYFIDKDANILAKVSGSGAELNENDNYQIIKLSGNFTGECSINNDNLLCRSNDVQSEPQYISCNKSSNDIVEYLETIDYLGNGKFSKPTINEKITAEEYISAHDIMCD